MNKPLRKASGWKWQKTRERILRRDKGLCQECARKGLVTPLSLETAEIDHIVSVDNGGSDDDCNLQSLCHGCHADKTAKDTGKRRKQQVGLDGWPIAE